MAEINKNMKEITTEERAEYWKGLEWGFNYTERCRQLLKIPKYKRQFLSCHSVYEDLKKLKKEIDTLTAEYENKIDEIRANKNRTRKSRKVL
jgi:ribosome recycling factor